MIITVCHDWKLKLKSTFLHQYWNNQWYPVCKWKACQVAIGSVLMPALFPLDNHVLYLLWQYAANGRFVSSYATETQNMLFFSQEISKASWKALSITAHGKFIWIDDGVNELILCTHEVTPWCICAHTYNKILILHWCWNFRIAREYKNASATPRTLQSKPKKIKSDLISKHRH